MCSFFPIPVVSRYFKPEQTVFQHLSRTDIMNNQEAPPVSRLLIHHQPDMRHPVIEHPCHNISRPIIRFHIFMYFFLQINAEFTVSANHDIGTHASAGWHISIRIVDPHISRIINHTFLRKQIKITPIKRLIPIML